MSLLYLFFSVLCLAFELCICVVGSFPLAFFFPLALLSPRDLDIGGGEAHVARAHHPHAGRLLSAFVGCYGGRRDGKRVRHEDMLLVPQRRRNVKNHGRKGPQKRDKGPGGRERGAGPNSIRIHPRVENRNALLALLAYCTYILLPSLLTT